MKMANQYDILDPSWMSLQGSFDEQVATIFENVRLTKFEVEQLRSLYCDVEGTLRSHWPECEVVPFGSIITGLGIKTSDVDCYVQIPSWHKNPGDKLVNTARNILRKRSHIFAQLFAIAHAKVPIVKFFHVPTGTQCDLSFKSPSGVRNSRLICYLLHLDRRAHYLAILVKYWSKVHHLTGTNLLPNYALTLLVIFFLQQVEILPDVASLQTHEEYVDNWNTAFCEKRHANHNEHTLSQLLGSFFAFYSTYDFNKNIISPYLGFSIPRESFAKVTTVPEDFVLYKDNVTNRVCKPLKIDTFMCIQDPFDHSRNCTVGVFPRLAQNVQLYFQIAAKIYEEEDITNFLRKLLTPRSVAQNKKDKAHRPLLNKVQKQNKPNFNSKKLKRNIHVFYEQMNKMKKGKR